eukprot:s76_g11.t1
MQGPMWRVQGVRSLPHLQDDRAEGPLPFLEPVPTFFITPEKGVKHQAQRPALPWAAKDAHAERVGTAASSRSKPPSRLALRNDDTSSSLPALGAWKDGLTPTDRWWPATDALFRTGRQRKLPTLKSPATPGPNSSSQRSGSPSTAKHGGAETRPVTTSQWPHHTPGHMEAAKDKAGVQAAEEAEEEKPFEQLLRELGRSKGCRRTITMTERKKNVGAALAGDKLFVQNLLNEGKENIEEQRAREHAVDFHWVTAAFTPIPEPRSLLPPPLVGRLPTKRQVRQVTVTSLSQFSRRSSATATMGIHDIALEIPEILEALKACNLFHALIAPCANTGVGDPPVMSRQTFCHLACAAQGFCASDGATPRLSRSAKYFDSLAEEILVKATGTTFCGIPLLELDTRSPGIVSTPMARLFSQIVQDITKEIEPQLVGLDAISQRGRAEKLARDQVFKKLLPQACKYAARRLVYVSDQTNSIMRVREHLSQEKPKEVTLERSRNLGSSLPSIRGIDALRRCIRNIPKIPQLQVSPFPAGALQ